MTRGTWSLGAAALVVALAWATPAAGEGRLRGLSSVETTILATPGALLAGDVPVLAVPRRTVSWPGGGGRARTLGRLPDLGPIAVSDGFADGDIRVWAAQPGRVVVARSGGSPVAPDFERRRGHQLVVGPPAGPFHDPAGCGEAASGPAALDGDRVAYVAAPAVRSTCAPGTPATVRARSVVVRDLAAGEALRAVFELPPGRQALSGISVSGPFLAYAWRVDDGEATAVAVVDLRDGHELASTAGAAFRQWALLPDGGLVVTDPPADFGDDVCDNRTRVRILRAGVPAALLPIRPCALALFALRDGRLVFGQRARDGRVDTLGLDVATGAGQRLATTSGVPVDVSRGRLVLDDETCSSGYDLRIAARSTVPVEPLGRRRCPAHVGPLRRAGRRFTLRVRCPRGCRLALRGPSRVVGTRDLRFARVAPGARTIRLSGADAGAHPAVTVEVLHPVARPTRVVRRLR